MPTAMLQPPKSLLLAKVMILLLVEKAVGQTSTECPNYPAYQFEGATEHVDPVTKKSVGISVVDGLPFKVHAKVTCNTGNAHCSEFYHRNGQNLTGNAVHKTVFDQLRYMPQPNEWFYFFAFSSNDQVFTRRLLPKPEMSFKPAKFDSTSKDEKFQCSGMKSFSLTLNLDSEGNIWDTSSTLCKATYEPKMPQAGASHCRMQLHAIYLNSIFLRVTAHDKQPGNLYRIPYVHYYELYHDTWPELFVNVMEDPYEELDLPLPMSHLEEEEVKERSVCATWDTRLTTSLTPATSTDKFSGENSMPEPASRLEEKKVKDCPVCETCAPSLTTPSFTASTTSITTPSLPACTIDNFDPDVWCPEMPHEPLVTGQSDATGLLAIPVTVTKIPDNTSKKGNETVSAGLVSGHFFLGYNQTENFDGKYELTFLRNNGMKNLSICLEVGDKDRNGAAYDWWMKPNCSTDP